MEILKNINLIIGKKYYFKFKINILLQIFLSFIEMIGLTFFFPLFSLLKSKDNIENFQILKKTFDFFNISESQYIYWCLIILFLLFLLKLASQIFIRIYTLKLHQNIRIKISQDLLNSFFFLDYEKSLNLKQSDKFSRLLINDNERFVYKALGCFSNLISEITLFLFILTVLIYYSSIKFLFIALFYILIIYLFLLFIKNYIKKLSLKRLLHYEFHLKNTRESINGIKEIIIYGAKKFFIFNLIKNLEKLINIEKNLILLEELPRYLIEFISAIIFLSVFFYLFVYLNNIELNDIIPILALYAVGALRIMPAINRIFSNLQGLNMSKVTINELSEYLGKKKRKDFVNEEINFTKKIEFKNVYFSHEDSTSFALKDFNFEIKKGDFIGIYGKSGLGKSTFLSILMGFLKPEKGLLLIDGKPLKKENIDSWQSKISLVSQNTFVLNTSLEKNISLDFDNHINNLEKTKNVLQISQLKNFYLTNKNRDLGDQGNLISGGEKQRVNIARAIYKDSEILVLDEPTSSLDKLTEENFFKKIKDYKNNKTIVLVTHNLSLLSACNKILHFQENHIVKEKE